MNNNFIKLALNAHLINYVEHETPRHYFIDGNADIEQVEDFAKLIIQEVISTFYDEMQYNFSSSLAKEITDSVKKQYKL